jgi:hypothetical protein
MEATYIPGYANQKRAMLLGGLLVMAVGCWQLWVPLRLVLFGTRATAEVVRLVKEKTGVAPVVVTDDAHLLAQLEPRDRSFVFWNEFRFIAADGSVHEFRSGIGSQLKPLYSLTDADGLPTTEVVYYDRARPDQVVLPLSISTWLAPGVLLLFGFGGAIIAAVLLYWADKPIELPQFPGKVESVNPPVP